MKIAKQQPITKTSHSSFYLKCGAILLLLLLSFLVIACGTTNTTTANLNSPQVTLTIRFDNNLSSLGTAAPYLCGAWITNTTPSFSPGSEIPVYAHFVHNVDGNPIGVSGASAQASVQWADGSTDTQSGITTGDGLAIFYFTIPNRPSMVGRNNLVTVSFTGTNGQTCSVNNQPQPAAFFTLIEASPTAPAVPSTVPTPKDARSSSTPPISITIPAFPPLGGGGRKTQPTPSQSVFPPGF